MLSPASKLLWGSAARPLPKGSPGRFEAGSFENTKLAGLWKNQINEAFLPGSFPKISKRRLALFKARPGMDWFVAIPHCLPLAYLQGRNPYFYEWNDRLPDPMEKQKPSGFGGREKAIGGMAERKFPASELLPKLDPDENGGFPSDRFNRGGGKTIGLVF